MATLFYMMRCSKRRREKCRKNECKTTQNKGKGHGKSGVKRRHWRGKKFEIKKNLGDTTHEGDDMNVISSHIHHFNRGKCMETV